MKMDFSKMMGCLSATKGLYRFIIFSCFMLCKHSERKKNIFDQLIIYYIYLCAYDICIKLIIISEIIQDPKFERTWDQTLTLHCWE